jgi:GMP synthase-like glutamine amidotransferase
MVGLQGWRYHVVGGDKDIEKMMDEACAISSSLQRAEIVIFSGGTDVDPSVYGQGRHNKTQPPDTDRDRIEQAIYHACVAKKKYLIGICRGAQLLNVLNGGQLWQHIDGHHGPHPLIYYDEGQNKVMVPVTSDHHQLMKPTADGRLWGVATESHRRESPGIVQTTSKYHNSDPEIVFYKATRSLCYQPHPEWGIASDRDLFMNCVRRLMLGG